jgi:hypothetical protein
MPTKQIALPESVRVTLHNEVMKYVSLFPTESGYLLGDRLRYTLFAGTARKSLVPPDIRDDSDELEFPLDVVYDGETEAIAAVVATINATLQALGSPRLQYINAYTEVIERITWEIPGACD